MKIRVTIGAGQALMDLHANLTGELDRPVTRHQLEPGKVPLFEVEDGEQALALLCLWQIPAYEEVGPSVT